jgi:hypothetical protein
MVCKRQPYSPRTNPDLPGRALSNTRLHNVPHVNLLDPAGLHAGALHCVLDGSDTQLRGGEGSERAVDAPDRGAGGGEDVDVLGRLYTFISVIPRGDPRCSAV